MQMPSSSGHRSYRVNPQICECRTTALQSKGYQSVTVGCKLHISSQDRDLHQLVGRDSEVGHQ